MPKLGVNIDHVATVRQARRGREPDPVWAAVQAELGGADGITLHLREDRRHIQDRDARLLRETVTVKYNLEMAATDEMVNIAVELKADQVSLVPEKREEITTEGGLDVAGNSERIAQVTRTLQQAGIVVSLFIDPDEAQVQAARHVGATAVELHTGRYAEAKGEQAVAREFDALKRAGGLAHELGLNLHLGHGLNYTNTQKLLEIPHVEEWNIGHSIVSRALFVGMAQAVREMKLIMGGN